MLWHQNTTSKFSATQRLENLKAIISNLKYVYGKFALCFLIFRS